MGCCKLRGTLSGVGTLSGSLTPATLQLGGALSMETRTNAYSGTYIVDPDWYTHVLDTNGKLMNDDVTVNPVSYSLATNSDINRLF